MDITKFRPNIVVASSNKRWDEDLWGEIALGPSSPEPYAKTILTSNCPRCISINIDFATGKPGEGATGEVLKQMQRDRRADKGSKYSPIFGRYGFLVTEGGSVVGDGREIKVGDEVAVTRRNGERTTFGKWALIRALIKPSHTSSHQDQPWQATSNQAGTHPRTSQAGLINLS
jgi:uncharacterized protein YcbX